MTYHVTVGHGGKNKNWQKVDDDVVEYTGVDDLKGVIISEVRTLNLY